MNCKNCLNKNNYSVVKNCSLCIKCYNHIQYMKGEPYCCNKCFTTRLRLNKEMICDECAGTEEDYKKYMINEYRKYMEEEHKEKIEYIE